MVGIAGKSKACLNCKKRRIKCDLALPSCLRCSKAGIPCQGYMKQTLWVNSTTEDPRVNAVSAIARSRQDSIQQTATSKWIQLFHHLQLQLSGANHETSYFRSQALRLLHGIYLPRPHLMEDSNGEPTPFSWLKAVCEMRRPSDALDHSLLAFCAIQVHMSGETSISQDQTVQLYNNALSKVIRDVGRNTDETLGSIVILSTCEVFVFSTDQGWSAHAQGISELLRYRGVQDEPTADWKSLCFRLCLICVIQALTQRCSLSLSPEYWQNLIGPVKAAESFTRLLMIITEIPFILNRGAELLSNGSNIDNFAFQCSDGLLEKFHELQSWRHLYECRATDGPLYWSILSRVKNPVDENSLDNRFPFALTFVSFRHAIPWIFCSTIMLEVLDTALQLRSSNTTTSLPLPQGVVSVDRLSSCQHARTSSPTQADADKLARLLCQSIEFFYGVENGTSGPQSTCYTQWTMRKYFRRRGLLRELEWCERIKDMEGPGVQGGIDLMRLWT